MQKTQTEYSDETTYRFKQHYFYQTSLLNAKDVILKVILTFYNLTTILLNRIQRLKHVGNIKLEGCGFKPCQLSDTVLFFSNTRTKIFLCKNTSVRRVFARVWESMQ